MQDFISFGTKMLKQSVYDKSNEKDFKRNSTPDNDSFSSIMNTFLIES